MRRLVFAAACSLFATISAHAAGFDGNWSVVQSCPDSKEAKGYKIDYPATIKDGKIHGQFRKVGESPNMTLEGTVAADGSATMRITGLTGNPKYSLKNVKAGFPVDFGVEGKFEGSKGTGKRTGGRPCDFTFAKK